MKPLNIIMTGSSKSIILALMDRVCDEDTKKVNELITDEDSDIPQEFIIQRGHIKVDQKYMINLYYANKPQQFEHFNEIQTDELKGLILILDSNKPSDLNNLSKTILKHFNYLVNYAMCIGIANTESEDGFNSKNVNTELKSNGWVMPVFDIDTNNKLDTDLLIEALIYFFKP